MNRFQKAIAVTTAAVFLGFGGLVSTSANAATNDQVADFLTSAVATHLGLTDTTMLHTVIVEAMNNGLIQQSVTDAASAAVDGTSTLTPDELAALLDANLTQQLGAIEQQLTDLGVLPTPTDPPVDPGTVDDDSDDVDDDSDDVEDNDESDSEHRGLDSSFTNDPQGDGVGHTEHGEGLGSGHLHHDDEGDNG